MTCDLRTSRARTPRQEQAGGAERPVVYTECFLGDIRCIFFFIITIFGVEIQSEELYLSTDNDFRVYSLRR